MDSFKIFQEVYLRTDDPRVTNVVKFSDSIGELRVEVSYLFLYWTGRAEMTFVWYYLLADI